jgi:hypothetical protein
MRLDNCRDFVGGFGLETKGQLFHFATGGSQRSDVLGKLLDLYRLAQVDLHSKQNFNILFSINVTGIELERRA